MPMTSSNSHFYYYVYNFQLSATELFRCRQLPFGMVFGAARHVCSIAVRHILRPSHVFRRCTNIALLIGLQRGENFTQSLMLS